jgi:hypothetical protein
MDAEGAGHASDALLCAKAAQLNSAAVKQTMDLPANMMFPYSALRALKTVKKQQS